MCETALTLTDRMRNELDSGLSATGRRRSYGSLEIRAGPSAVAQCKHELSALFERESAPVAQWIRAADFGLSRPMRCSPSVGGGA